ncbi:FAD binding domain-containing protein [Phakopsora pachyrhizi]|uniref:FAD binding domain-domain-containing protein n=1 Tax=Phakopsora pachyrhizi TaxID=170000 RepID=A0AAV0ATI0_PHAPC|nr:FAD binding domain-containing protein [Phakopsora pachyrhizi]CAH7672897.1 FAD binding domain-domain-containing protein [Phakopsora pachyrhizi]
MEAKMLINQLSNQLSELTAKQKQSDVDVLIIGAGPAGLMAAACLARYGVHNVRIVDKRSTKIFTGQATGLNCRSLETFQALGMGNQLFSEVNELSEICFWNPNKEGVIERSGRTSDNIPGLSRFRQSVIHQGRIERMFLDKISEWSRPSCVDSTETPQPKIRVERAVCPDMIKLPIEVASPLSNIDSDRIIVRLRHLSESEAKPAQFTPLAKDGLYRSNMFEDDLMDAIPIGLPKEELLEEVRCRFIIGADGARSWTRNEIGFKLEGESSNFFWGVIDGIPVTNFPDIRMRCTIHSAENGSMMVIPRENNLVRLYIQIPQPEEGKRPNRADVTPDKLMVLAQSILAPYTIEIPEIDWYTCYEIGQRLANRWVWNNRVFMAGDACHTHSPKAGQGMNISMADTFNLSWKLAHVIQGKAKMDILNTYEEERSLIAAELIEFDHRFASQFSGKPALNVLDSEGISIEEFQKTLQKGRKFSSGTSVDYPPSLIVAKPAKCGNEHSYSSELATGIPVGQRLFSTQVVGVSDAIPYQLADLANADGRWKILIFAGDIAKEIECKERLNQLAVFLAENPNSPIKKFSDKEDPHSVINCLTILASSRVLLDPESFPDILRPKVGKHGYRSYNKIFTDDESHYFAHGKAYETYGINPSVGCVAIVRPDQHVSMITKVEDREGIASFFNRFMIPPTNNAVDLIQA